MRVTWSSCHYIPPKDHSFHLIQHNNSLSFHGSALTITCYKKPKCLFWCLIIAILLFHIQLQRWIWTLHCLLIDRKTKAKLGSTFSYTLENLMPYWLHLKMPIALTSLLDILTWPIWYFLFHKLLLKNMNGGLFIFVFCKI